MTKVTEKIIVQARLEDGDVISLSVKQVDKPISEADIDSLINKSTLRFKVFEDRVLYYTVRTKLAEGKDNFKVKSIDALIDVLNTKVREKICKGA